MTETLPLPAFTPAAGTRLAVVGGCGGMGRALVQAALQLGLEVAALDLERSIAQAPPPAGAWAVPCDVAQETAVQAAFGALRERWGAIDALVNLAGYTGERVAIEHMTTAEWDAIVDTDLRGMFLVAREAAPLLRAAAAQGRQPAVVLVSSTFGVRVVHAGYGPYAASKAGVINLVRALATEWAPAIRVNGLAPGIIETPFLSGGTGRATRTTNLDLQKFVASVPLQRLGQPLEIATTLLFLLSPAASYVHAQTLHVNGGSFAA